MSFIPKGGGGSGGTGQDGMDGIDGNRFRNTNDDIFNFNFDISISNVAVNGASLNGLKKGDMIFYNAKYVFQVFAIGNVNTTFEFLGDISGAQGIQGDAGAQGIQGEKGDKGDQGVGANDNTRTIIVESTEPNKNYAVRDQAVGTVDYHGVHVPISFNVVPSKIDNEIFEIIDVPLANNANPSTSETIKAVRVKRSGLYEIELLCNLEETDDNDDSNQRVDPRLTCHKAAVNGGMVTGITAILKTTSYIRNINGEHEHGVLHIGHKLQLVQLDTIFFRITDHSLDPHTLIKDSAGGGMMNLVMTFVGD